MPLREKLSELFKPDEIVDKMYAINLTHLKRIGIQGLVIDVDNTLLAPQEQALSLHANEWLKRAQGFGFKLLLVSNEVSARRVTALSKILNIPGVHSVYKPLPWGLEGSIKNLLGIAMKRAAIIGDTLMTDIFPGKLLGAYTILVEPINIEVEPMNHWIIRRAGDALVRVITRKN